MKQPYLIILLLLFMGCNPPGAGVTMNGAIKVHFYNSEGNNLFSSNNSDYSLNNLRLYYYDKDMNYTLRYSAKADSPYYISDVLENDFVLIYPIFGSEDGQYIEGGKSTSYLDFGNGDIDTIQVSGVIKPGFSSISQVWYNGKYMGNDALLNGLDVLK